VIFITNLFFIYAGSKVFTTVDMNTAFFWDIAPCNPYVNQRFEETYHLHLHGRKSAEQETSLQQVGSSLLPTDYAALLTAVHTLTTLTSGEVPEANFM
jgi:hypothetical protein